MEGHFPASGYRIWDSGTLFYVSTHGFYWSALPYSATHGYSLAFYSVVVHPLATHYRGHGMPIRSVME